MFKPAEFFSFMISPVTRKDLTLKNLTMQDGSTFPLWTQKGWAGYHTALPGEFRVWVKCLLLQLPRFLGEGVAGKVGFLHGWSQALSKKTKQNTHGSWKGSTGSRQAWPKEYQIVEMLDLCWEIHLLHTSLKQWRPQESILTNLGSLMHFPGRKYHEWLLHPAQNLGIWLCSTGWLLGFSKQTQ